MEKTEELVDCPSCHGLKTIKIEIKFISDHADLKIRRCRICGYELTNDDIERIYRYDENNKI